MPNNSSLRAKRIREATLKARHRWEDYTLAERQQIFDLLDRSADRIVAAMESLVVKGKYPPVRLTLLHRSIKSEMARLRPALQRRIKAGMSESINLGMESGIYTMLAAGDDLKKRNIQIGTSHIAADGTVLRYRAGKEIYTDSTWARINGEAMDALLRFKPSGITLSRRVWDITWQAEKAMRQSLGTSVLIGESPARLSRIIRGHLAQPDKLFRRVRGKDGKLKLSKPAMLYHPGPGVYRSAFQNAVRLARTEYARAYTEGTLRYAAEKTWIKGYISHTTSGNPAPYDASIDGMYFPKGSQPAPPYHPNCMCYLELVYSESPKSEYANADQLKGPDYWNQKTAHK